MATDPTEVANRLAYHPADEYKGAAIAMNRDLFTAVAMDMAEVLPESREKALCLTAIQEAMMWANAAVAIHVPAVTTDGA